MNLQMNLQLVCISGDTYVVVRIIDILMIYIIDSSDCRHQGHKEVNNPYNNIEFLLIRTCAACRKFKVVNFHLVLKACLNLIRHSFVEIINCEKLILRFQQEVAQGILRLCFHSCLIFVLKLSFITQILQANIVRFLLGQALYVNINRMRQTLQK